MRGAGEAMWLLTGCINAALVILKRPLTSQSVWFGAAAGEIEALTVDRTRHTECRAETICWE